MNKHEHYTNAKAVVGFLIVALGLGMLVLFQNNSNSIMTSNTSQWFIAMLFAGAALLLGLFYLVSQTQPAKAVRPKKTSKHKR